MKNEKGEDNLIKEAFKKTEKELKIISPSFCPAKWLQITLHLENGHTHSCHHPDTHKIDITTLESDPSTLHNTQYKKEMRQMMLSGDRPSECHYCWNIEDNTRDYSDRIYKAVDSWSSNNLDRISLTDYSKNVNPSYMEVSFSSVCNFKCIYCSPAISSSLHKEYKRYGDYICMQSLGELKNLGKIVEISESKKYVEAFWNWYPTLINDLNVLRITGGEPLLHLSTFRILEDILNNPKPKLELSVNTNFCVADKAINKYIDLSKQIANKGAVKKLIAFASIDSYKNQAEYIRYGLDYDLFVNNVKKYLTETKSPVVIMATFNLLSIPGFISLLKDVIKLKRLASELDIDNGVVIDISQLEHPHFLSVKIITEELKNEIQEILNYMKNENFSFYELHKLERILDYIKENNESKNEIERKRKDFSRFIKEYDRRKGVYLTKVFPQLADFYHLCEKLEV